MGQILFAPSGAGVTSDDVTATKAQVLSGYTALTKDSNDDPISGTMTNRGAWTSSSSGSGKITVPAGYHNGSGYVDCSGAYNKGVTDADNRTNTNSANYKAGYNAGITAADARVNTSSASYNSGYAKGNSVKPSNFIIGVAVAVKQQGFSGVQYTWGSGCRGNVMNVTIDPGYYYHVAVFNGNWNSKSWVTNKNGYASSTLTFAITDGNELTSMAVAMTSNYPIF